MVVYQVAHGKISYEQTLYLHSETNYIYVICRSSAKLHWQGDITAEDGCQIFLHPGQSFTLHPSGAFLLYDLVEFSPNDTEQEIIDSLFLPENFSVPSHLAELSTRIRSIYDIHFSADKYRSEKSSLLVQMLLYSIASGDPDGEYLNCSSAIDHSRSFEIELRLEFSAISLAECGEWADDIYLCISNADVFFRNSSEQIILECETMRQEASGYCLGLSCHSCHNGTWNERIFKTSKPAAFPIRQLTLRYSYDAASRLYEWIAIEPTSGHILHRHQVNSDFVPDALSQSSAVHLHLYRNPVGINIKSLLLRYTDRAKEGKDITPELRGEEEYTTAKGQLNRKLRRLRTLISDDPARPWTIQKAAAFVNLSESRFYFLYKEYFGLTFINDVIRARINKSCYLLVTNHSPIKTICKEVGYENETLFYRQFKEQVGISPSEYRKMNTKM